MAFNPGVNFFVNFYDLDPFRQRQCIYFTKKGTRCRWNCHQNARARLLHRRILASNSENLSTEDIIEYLLSNCCTYDSAIDPFEKVEHRDWIEDAGLVLPLANRWKGEILGRLRLSEARTKVERSSPSSSPAPTLLGSSPASTTYGASAISTPNRHSVNQTPITDPSYYNTRSTPSSSRTPASPSPQLSPTPAPRGAAISNLFGSQAIREQSPYSEDSSDAGARAYRTSSLEDRYSQPPESEFRPHKARPSSNETVSSIMRRVPQRRDNETGFIYIFDRDGSPGHVKIGWTAVGVQQRLEDWSKHGYTPRLVFETERIPNAQRAETLTHYELITEWRRELRCRNPVCDVKHQEWFEVSLDRAKQVVANWAEFFKKAKPFDELGYLKKQWKDRLDEMSEKGEAVTAARMLAHYEALVHSATTIVQNTSPVPPTKSVKQENITGEPEKIEPNILGDIAQVLQTTLEVFKKESLLAHQEFMKELRSTQDQFMEKLKSLELTVEDTAISKPVVETAKPTVTKRRIKVRIPKPKEEWVSSSKDSAVPASLSSKSLSKLRLQQGSLPVGTTVSISNSRSPNGEAQEEKLASDAQPLPTQPGPKGDADFEVTLTSNFKSVKDGGMSLKKEAGDSIETLSAKAFHFKALPALELEPLGNTRTSLGASLTPQYETLGTETKCAHGETSFSGGAFLGTKDIFGGMTPKGTSLFGTKAMTQGSSFFGSKITPEDGTSFYETKTISTDSSLFGAKAMPTFSPSIKATSTSLFGATVTPKGIFKFGTKAASAEASVFGGKSVSEGFLFGNKASSTGSSVFDISIKATHSSLSCSKTPVPGNFAPDIQSMSSCSESFSFGKTTSPSTMVPSIATAAPSASKSSLSGTKGTYTQRTSLSGTGTILITPFGLGPDVTTPSTYKLPLNSETPDIVLSNSVSKPLSKCEGTSVNSSSKDKPLHNSETPLKEVLSTTSSTDAVLTSSKFDSQIKVESNGLESNIDFEVQIAKDMLAAQKVSQGEQMQATEDKKIVGTGTLPISPSIKHVSKTSISVQLEEKKLDEQDVEAGKSKEQDRYKQGLEEDQTPDEEDLKKEQADKASPEDIVSSQ